MSENTKCLKTINKKLDTVMVFRKKLCDDNH